MRHLLLVEDEPLVRMLAQEVLQDAGFEVLEAANGEEAIGWLDRLDHVDLLITDLSMPGRQNGVNVTLHARTRFPQLPVIVTTGFVDDAMAQFGQVDPPPALLEKPYRTERLITLACTLASEAPPAR